MILGITGNYGSGKTTVAKMFKDYNIIDVDEIGHLVLDNQGYEKVVETFGEGILNDNLEIDRAKLRQLVFNNKDKLNILESILHPLMIIEVEKEIKRLAKPIVIDAALLFEMNLNNYCDKTITVTCNMQEERIASIDTKLILSTQTPEKDLILKSDFTIDNNGTIEESNKQVEEIIKQI